MKLTCPIFRHYFGSEVKGIKVRTVIKIRDNPGTKTWAREQTITTNKHKIIIITKTNTRTENRPSVNFSHFHLLWNRFTDINQTWQGCWGEGPLQSIYISLWFDEIHGHQRRSSILIDRFSKMFCYEITMQNNLKLCRNVLCEVFYKRFIRWTKVIH